MALIDKHNMAGFKKGFGFDGKQGNMDGTGDMKFLKIGLRAYINKQDSRFAFQFTGERGCGNGKRRIEFQDFGDGLDSIAFQIILSSRRPYFKRVRKSGQATETKYR